MTEPTIVTILRADHHSGLHSEPHRPNKYCEDCHPPIQLGWQVTDPDGNVIESGGVSIAKADGKLAELIEQLKPEGDQQ